MGIEADRKPDPVFVEERFERYRHHRRVMLEHRDQKDELAQRIFALAGTYPRLEWVSVTMNVADRAAELRARYRLSTPDAIQLATAILHKAVRFYGNDRGLRKVKEIECVLIDELI